MRRWDMGPPGMGVPAPMAYVQAAPGWPPGAAAWPPPGQPAPYAYANPAAMPPAWMPAYPPPGPGFPPPAFPPGALPPPLHRQPAPPPQQLPPYYGQLPPQQLPPQQLPLQQLQQQLPQRHQPPQAQAQPSQQTQPARQATPNPRPSKRVRTDGEAQQPGSHGDEHAAGTGAAAGQLQAASAHPSPRAAAWLDELQRCVLRFAEGVVPTPAEQAERDAVLSVFSSIARGALQHQPNGQRAQVRLFGSGASSLALHVSDLDVAITGLAAPTDPRGGYDEAAKPFVNACLKRIERAALYGPQARALDGGLPARSRLIARARIPVLKVQLERSGLELDISLNDESGVRAARFLDSFQHDFPVLRPLILLLKACLKQRNLADVSTGGLGSWSLANMVIAHLQMEDAAGHAIDHAGEMLLSFLRRFGVDFDLNNEAVAVACNGIVPRSLLRSSAPGQNFNQLGRLMLQDPLTGREAAGGSHRYADVAALLNRLHRRLAAALAAAEAGRSHEQPRRRGGGAGDRGRWGDVEARGRWDGGGAALEDASDDAHAAAAAGAAAAAAAAAGAEAAEEAGDDEPYDTPLSPTYAARHQGPPADAADGDAGGFGALDLLLDVAAALARQHAPPGAAPARAGDRGGGRDRERARADSEERAGHKRHRR